MLACKNRSGSWLFFCFFKKKDDVHQNTGPWTACAYQKPKSSNSDKETAHSPILARQPRTPRTLWPVGHNRKFALQTQLLTHTAFLELLLNFGRKPRQVSIENDFSQWIDQRNIMYNEENLFRRETKAQENMRTGCHCCSLYASPFDDCFLLKMHFFGKSQTCRSISQCCPGRAVILKAVGRLGTRVA